MSPELVHGVDLLPIVIYTVLVIVVVGGMICGSAVLGQRRRDRATAEQFESGVVPAGDVDSRMRFSVHFYLVAIFFVIFDLEAVFVFAWAIAFREAGWAGFIEISIFILILVAGLVYLWRIGALEWRTRRQKLQESKVQKGWL